jgi:hypothetical protein
MLPFNRIVAGIPVILFALVTSAPQTRADFPPSAEARLGADGKALLRVTIAAEASDRVKTAAQTLADYLARIAGAKFEIAEGDGTSGLAIGLPAHFPKLNFQPPWKTGDFTQTEDYLLRSHSQGIYLLGATELAVEHAVSDLLYRLGHRQFFPGPTWDVVPRQRDLRIDVDAHEHPDYYSRRIWYGYGAADYARGPYAEWCARNRATEGIRLSSGHAYDGILRQNKAEFDAHPEYLGLVDGQRKSTKFCISNPGLRKLVVNDAIRRMEKDLSQQSLSMEPSDGGGWCKCDACSKLGNISDRAVLLANDVADAINAKFGDKLVGMYAYAFHSQPPTIRVHPRVVISVATAFVQGGYTVDQLLAGWQAQGATLGIREYYSVNTWDRDLPGAARGGSPTRLAETVPHFHALGARYLSAESSDNWGPNGLGYYLAGRILWDIDEAKRVPELIDDFLTRAFGPARAPMAEFYRHLDGAKRPLLSDDLVGRMYRRLDEARSLTDDVAILARIDDLVLYTRYVELWTDYVNAEGPVRQQAYETLLGHAYRMRRTMMIHTMGLWRDLVHRDKSLTMPTEAAWNVPEGKNPWKKGEPYAAAEIASLVSEGIARRKLLDFTPAAFSENLISARSLKLATVPTGSTGLLSRGLRTYYTFIESAPATISLQASGGHIYQSQGDAKISLYPLLEPEGKAVAQAAIPPDKHEHAVELKSTFTGLHRIEVFDGTSGTKVNWPDGTPTTLPSSVDKPTHFHGRWNLYFYVPKGTKIVGGFASGPGRLVAPAKRLAHTFDGPPGYFSIPVAASEDGQLWKFEHTAGDRLLMTVPPYLARNAEELLLPAEVVETDKPK